MTDTYPLGAVVPLTFRVYDVDGEAADPTDVVLTLTLPDGTTEVLNLQHPETGLYQADYRTIAAGSHTARFVTTGENAGAIEDVFLVAAVDLARVTLQALRNYLGDTSDTDATLLEALAAEQAAQASRCRLDPYTADLREALLRRVARNLAARAIRVTTYTSFEGGGGATQRVPPSDPEIRRLEGPHRRRTVG